MRNFFRWTPFSPGLILSLIGMFAIVVGAFVAQKMASELKSPLHQLRTSEATSADRLDFNNGFEPPPTTATQGSVKSMDPAKTAADFALCLLTLVLIGAGAASVAERMHATLKKQSRAHVVVHR